MSAMSGVPVHAWVRLCLFISLISATALVQAQSGVGPVAAEATIFEDRQSENAGGYADICIGNLDGVITTRRAFARFDLPEIPEGATVTRVVYNFTQLMVRFIGPGAPKTADLELRRVNEAWEEGTGVRLNASCGGGANVPGVDWANAPAVAGGVSGGAFLPTNNNVPITIDTDIGADDDGLIADVQAWVDDPGSNFGWDYRVAAEATLDNARQLMPGSITIHWTLPPTPSILVAKTGMFDPGENGETDPGDLIDYTITVTNDGEALLNTIAVSDPLIPVISCPGGNPIPMLAPAAMAVCTGTYAITQDDIDTGQVDNLAIATGQCGSPGCPVMDSDSHSEPIPPPPLNFADGFEDAP